MDQHAAVQRHESRSNVSFLCPSRSHATAKMQCPHDNKLQQTATACQADYPKDLTLVRATGSLFLLGAPDGVILASGQCLCNLPLTLGIARAIGIGSFRAAVRA